MKALIAITFATVYGLSVRLLYGFLDPVFEIVSLTFMMLLPVILGMLSIFFIPGRKRLSGWAVFFLPWLTIILVLIITIITRLEGLICWLMAFPLFLLLASLGGAIGNSLRNLRIPKEEDKGDKIDFRRDQMTVLPLAMILPLIIGFIEGDKTLDPERQVVERSVLVPATPGRIWQAIGHIDEVEAGEKPTHVANFMGFPRHLHTTLDTLALGGKRTAVYEGGLVFDETISRYEPGRLMELSISTDPQKVPPTVLDEHIVIGGKHVDVEQDVYTLQALPDGTCRLTLSSRYMINTPFNWYAGIWAKWLMGDLLQGELELISERAVRG